MIKEIKYIFNDSLNTSLGYSIPGIDIITLPNDIPDECILALEIMQLSGEYVKEIVDELKEVKEGKKDYYAFGFETTHINILKKGFQSPVDGKKYYDGLVYITYNYGEDEIDTELKIEQILKMMIDWRDYIDNWEKETGKVYEGV